MRWTRRAKTERRRYNFDIALCAEGKKQLQIESLCNHLLHLHEICSREARLVKAFAARYRLHRADAVAAAQEDKPHIGMKFQSDSAKCSDNANVAIS